MTPFAPRSILAATDLTEASDEVLRAAGALARRTGAALHVIHSFDFPPSPYWDDTSNLTTFQARVDRAERALEAQVKRVLPDTPLASLRVEIYTAHRAIVEYAGAVDAGVIVMGPHARRQVELPFLGTTADRVLRTSPVPVMIVRAPIRLPLRRVVVPLDLSEPARGALDLALAWSRALGTVDPETPVPDTEMHILHVIPKVLAPVEMPFDRAQVAPGINREVRDALARSGGAADVDVREEVRWADGVAEEIVRFAGERRADLVVLATHGHGALTRALVGGTASGVAREAPCPVLLVPPRIWRGRDSGGNLLSENEVIEQLPALAG